MAEVVALVTGAITTLKKLREVSKKIKDAEAKNLIADLMIALADIKTQLAELQDENRRLQTELGKASETRDFRNNLQIQEEVYFFKEPVEGRPTGPYCPRCFDVDGTLVLVTKLQGHFEVFGKYGCPECEQHYGQA